MKAPFILLITKIASEMGHSITEATYPTVASLSPLFNTKSSIFNFDKHLMAALNQQNKNQRFDLRSSHKFSSSLNSSMSISLSNVSSNFDTEFLNNPLVIDLQVISF